MVAHAITHQKVLVSWGWVWDGVVGTKGYRAEVRPELCRKGWPRLANGQLVYIGNAAGRKSTQRGQSETN